jgi:thioredoxin-dependent peroxiredoxin
MTTENKDLQENAIAPDFSMVTTSGDTLNLKDLRGKPVVLYFYPKDDTPGCTKEACNFRDNMAIIAPTGALIYGVSPDSVASHAKFTKKYELNFPLLSDEGAKVANAYGVWKEKNMYGKKYMGIERTTFLIDEDGKIAKIWRKVKPEGHAVEVLNFIKSRS